MHQCLWLAEPCTYVNQRLAQKRKRRLRRIQTAEPSSECGWIGHPIGIFDGGRSSFPGTAFQKITPQSLAARDQAVMTVGRREQRQKGERFATPVTEAAANRNPIVVFIMRLLAPAAMADDGVLQANRAST